MPASIIALVTTTTDIFNVMTKFTSYIIYILLSLLTIHGFYCVFFFVFSFVSFFFNLHVWRQQLLADCTRSLTGTDFMPHTVDVGVWRRRGQLSSPCFDTVEYGLKVSVDLALPDELGCLIQLHRDLKSLATFASIQPCKDVFSSAHTVTMHAAPGRTGLHAVSSY